MGEPCWRLAPTTALSDCFDEANSEGVYFYCYSIYGLHVTIAHCFDSSKISDAGVLG